MGIQWKLSVTKEAHRIIRGFTDEEGNPLADKLEELITSANPMTHPWVKPVKFTKGAWFILKEIKPQVRIIFRITDGVATVWLGDPIPTGNEKTIEILFAGRRCDDFYKQVKTIFEKEFVDA